MPCCLAPEPQRSGPRYNLAVALQAKGDLVSSRKEYKKALKLIPRTCENQAEIKSIKSVLSSLAGAMR
jgi:Flp pilus assembly protein TadD